MRRRNNCSSSWIFRQRKKFLLINNLRVYGRDHMKESFKMQQSCRETNISESKGSFYVFTFDIAFDIPTKKHKKIKKKKKEKQSLILGSPLCFSLFICWDKVVCSINTFFVSSECLHNKNQKVFIPRDIKKKESKPAACVTFGLTEQTKKLHPTNVASEICCSVLLHNPDGRNFSKIAQVEERRLLWRIPFVNCLPHQFANCFGFKSETSFAWVRPLRQKHKLANGEAVVVLFEFILSASKQVIKKYFYFFCFV